MTKFCPLINGKCRNNCVLLETEEIVKDGSKYYQQNYKCSEGLTNLDSIEGWLSIIAGLLERNLTTRRKEIEIEIENKKLKKVKKEKFNEAKKEILERG